jgi:peptidylprolyl isomerase
MKKSEKVVKGQDTVAAARRKKTMYGIGIAFVVIVIAVIGYSALAGNGASQPQGASGITGTSTPGSISPVSTSGGAPGIGTASTTVGVTGGVTGSVKNGDNVSVFYTGTLDNGTVFDTNANGAPLQFTVGAGQLIPGFDAGVVGMAVGETKTVHIPVASAYGPYDPQLVATLNRSNLSLTTAPFVGENLTATNPATGGITRMKVINVTPATITVDANPLLAGQNLTFTIRLASINP